MNHSDFKREYIAYLVARKITPDNKQHKKSNMSQYIDMLEIQDCPIEKSGLAEIEQFLLQKSYLKTSTLNRIITHFKELYRYLLQHNMLERDCNYLIKYRKTPKKLPRNINHSLMIKLCTPTEDELATLDKPRNIRNQAIIEFLYSTGVRNTELRSLTISQLSHDLRKCWIVTQKGGRSRTVFLGKYARITLYQYLQTRGIDCKHLKAHQKYEYVFLSSHKRMMTTQTLKNIVKNLAIKRIGIVVTPHMIRHTFATDMLRRYNCLRTLQKLMGHRNIKNTVRYCHLAMADKIKTINGLPPSLLGKLISAPL